MQTLQHRIIALMALTMGVFSSSIGLAQSQKPVAPPPVLESNPMQKQIEAAIYEYWLSIQSLHRDRFAANFAPDGTLEDPAGTPPVVGRQAIAAFFGGGFQALDIGRVTPRIKQMFVGVGQSTEVMVQWELTAYTRATGKQAIVHGIGLFKFKPIFPGARLQLESVREFYDPLEFTSQLQ